MGKMWKGPSEALIAARSNPIAVRLHRRASKYNIAYGSAGNGLACSVFSVRQIGDKYVLDALGDVVGGDPMDAFINASLQYTPHDAELFQLCGQLVAERTEAIINEIHSNISKVTGITELLESTMAPLKSSHVGS